ncbi:MAG: hypothetical protein ACM3N6_01375 [Betaproteobacteria bacterium]
MKPFAISAAVVVAASVHLPALAHGFVGQRFFPATIATDDPFVADELSLPTVSTQRVDSSAEPPTRQRSIEAEFSKRITSDFGISLGVAHQRISAQGQPAVSGYENVDLGFKYQLHRSEAHESLIAVGLGWEIGGTGSRAVREPVSTFTPTFFFGKGFGDLPNSWSSLKPLAVTGTVGVAFPSRSSTVTTSVDPDTGATASDTERHPNVLQLGLAAMYSLPYLQSAVRDVGLRAPLDRMIPIVEIALERPLNRVENRRVKGTVNPGLLWAGRHVQLGLEAIVPINRRSGHGVGAVVQLHFFLDDIFPRSIGRPLFGSAP